MLANFGRLRLVGVAGAVGACASLAGPASGQEPPDKPARPKIDGPTLRARGVSIPVRGEGPAGTVLRLERRTARGWTQVGRATPGPDRRATVRYRPPTALDRVRLRLRTRGAEPSRTLTVRIRDITLAAFGDANFGNGVANVMARRGDLWPWRGVAPTLRAADIAFGNLECSISTRGAPVPKEFRFRGRPAALRRVVRFAGLDALNLANNHVGDYGGGALLDTIRNVRSAGVAPIGAGATLAAARRPQVVTRLGLRVAFVGFSDIGPVSFAAGPRRPGTAFASIPAIRAGVRAARRRGDVVVATFHWGVERATRENARQRAFARAALEAGAHAVIGAHPHVLQPVRRAGGRRVVAYSLGNFVWAAGSALTSRTGILRLRLSARGVEGSRLLRARISQTRPELVGR